MNRYNVRLRTTPEWLVWGYSFAENAWEYRYLDGPLFSSSGEIPNLDGNDVQENYWVIETQAGDKYAFQSADVEEVTVYEADAEGCGKWGCRDCYPGEDDE